MSRSRGRRRGTYQVIEGEPLRRDQGPRITRGEGAFDLGDLSGEVVEQATGGFEYFGEWIRVNPDLTEVDIIDFLDQADHVKPDDPKSMIMIKDAVRAHVHPEDFDRFWALRKANRQGVQHLMGTIWQIVGGITGGKAATPPSGSSGGRPVINQSLPATSSAPATAPSDDVQAKYQRQIDRFEALGTANGVAMAAQILTLAEARGVTIDDPLLQPTA